MKRRATVGLAGSCLIAWAHPGSAQTRTYRIGLLSNNPWTDRNALAFWNTFKTALHHLGWVEGGNVSFELASPDSAFHRLPEVARELVSRGVDLIVVAGGLAAAAVRAATTSLPVVFVAAGDPVRSGLVNSLARPGGNITGVSDISDELWAKRLELLLEIARVAKRVAILTTGTGIPRFDEEVARMVTGLGLQPVVVQAAREAELSAAVNAHAVDAWFISDTIRALAREPVIEALATRRKPVVYPNSVFVRLGGLLSYAAQPLAQARRAAWYVDRILRGSRPADIPIELPAQLELVLNLRTAHEHGIAIPQSVLQRADEVIE